MSLVYNSNCHPTENGYHYDKYNFAYQPCNCCPYGYHIDLDFVRYCESLERTGGPRTDTMDRRRERRRQRQSMEVMLGLINNANNAAQWGVNSQPLPQIPQEPCSPHREQFNNDNLRSTLVQDLGDVVSDFERTQLQFANHGPSHHNHHINNIHNNIDLHRAHSNSSVSSSNSGDMAAASIGGRGGSCELEPETTGLSPRALRSIREQMALGLERMKELEEKVKVIPSLQVQIAVLKDEKRKLLENLKEQQNQIKIDTVDHKKQVSKTQCRDMGVMCGVLTRHIGVGPNYPKTRENSTITDEEINELNKQPEKSVVSQSSQTRIYNREATTQFPTTQKQFRTTAITVKPEIKDFGLQVQRDTKTVGVSDDDINTIFCLKCSAAKRTIGVGPSNYADQHLPVSLKSLSQKSKSFNLGEEKLNLNLRYRTIGCQSENFTVHKSSQYEIKSHSQFSQTESKIVRNESVQYELKNITQITDTHDLHPKKDASCATNKLITIDVSSNTPPVPIDKPKCAKCELRGKNKDVGCATIKVHTVDVSLNTTPMPVETKTKCSKCISEAKEERISEKSKKEETNVSMSGSRIPRPAHVTTPTEIRKFKRQDTYTKIPAVTITEDSLSGLDLSPTTASKIELGSIETNSFSKVKQSLHLPEVKSSSSHGQSSHVSLTHISSHVPSHTESKNSIPSQSSATLSEPPLYSLVDRNTREKILPSREMQAAMKVLNDSLQKSRNNNIKSQVQRALDIIQQEWFKISSTASANPLNVEDYLDCFEEISSALLQFIVNMTDDSGNTAMHYAVSHANFDVVSILLDSKVCNINKANKAGYTSVMLVSLTEIRSPTHTTVVKKLFQLADVNIRARQHGQTALMLAVSHGRLDMVQMLIEAGADINIQDDDGSTALMCAAEHGHIDIVKYFLNQPDCDSAIVDADGSSALKIALEAGHKDIGVLLYAHEHSIRGTSPYSSLQKRKSKGSSSKSSMTSLPQGSKESKSHK